MHTQTHVLIGAALFGRRVSSLAWAAALGGLLPDIPMLAIVAALKLYGIHNFIIYGILYWQNWWQVANAVAHNFWLWGGLLLASIVLRERRTLDLRAIDGWTVVIVFAASGFLHAAVDFLCHREDAHMSFWPLTRWTFMSPVSYWDPSHFGHQFAVFEATTGIICAVTIFRTYKGLLLRLALLVAMALYAAVPAYFILS